MRRKTADDYLATAVQNVPKTFGVERRSTVYVLTCENVDAEVALLYVLVFAHESTAKNCAQDHAMGLLIWRDCSTCISASDPVRDSMFYTIRRSEVIQ